MQKMLFGGYEMTDRYGGARARNEWLHSQAKSDNEGQPALSGDRFQVATMPGVALIVTVAFMATNHRVGWLYLDRVARNEGVAPWETRVEWRAARDRNRKLFDALRDTRLPSGPANYRKHPQAGRGGQWRRRRVTDPKMDLPRPRQGSGQICVNNLLEILGAGIRILEAGPVLVGKPAYRLLRPRLAEPREHPPSPG